MKIQPKPKPQPPTTFHCFQQLPFDLRFEIWKHLCVPQVLCFYFTRPQVKGPAVFNINRPPPWKHVFSTHCQVPTILHICQESRRVALAHYSRGFEIYASYRYNQASPNSRFNKPCQFEYSITKQNKDQYWDPRCDVVYLTETRPVVTCGSRSTCRKNYTKLQVSFDIKLQYLVISLDMMVHDFTPSWVRYIPNLKTVFIMVGDDFTSRWRKPWEFQGHPRYLLPLPNTRRETTDLVGYKQLAGHIWNTRFEDFVVNFPSYADSWMTGLEFETVACKDDLVERLKLLRSLSS